MRGKGCLSLSVFAAAFLLAQLHPGKQLGVVGKGINEVSTSKEIKGYKNLFPASSSAFVAVKAAFQLFI